MGASRLSSRFSLRFGSRFLGRSGIGGAIVGAAGASNVFLAAYYSSSDYLLALQVFGEGTPTSTHTATIYRPDYQGIYREFKADEPVWEGGRVGLDPAKNVITLTASANTPDPLATLQCYFNDGSTASYHCGSQVVMDVASAVNAGAEVSVVEGDSVGVYAGNLTALTNLYLYGNQLTGSIPVELGNLTSLTVLYLHFNQLTGSIPPELGNLSSLKALYLYSNQLTDYQGGATINYVNTISIDISANALTESAVNNYLIDCANGTLGAASTINLSGGTNAAPTGAGLTAKNALIASGHTVITG